jgi:hypothetical protein
LGSDLAGLLNGMLAISWRNSSEPPATKRSPIHQIRRSAIGGPDTVRAIKQIGTTISPVAEIAAAIAPAVEQQRGSTADIAITGGPDVS